MTCPHDGLDCINRPRCPQAGIGMVDGLCYKARKSRRNYSTAVEHDEVFRAVKCALDTTKRDHSNLSKTGVIMGAIAPYLNLIAPNAEAMKELIGMTIYNHTPKAMTIEKTRKAAEAVYQEICQYLTMKGKL